MTKLEKVSFEEALNLTGFGKYNLLTFLLCSGIILGMTFELFSVAYVVPASACELLTSSNQQGLMAAVPLIGVITTSQIWGYLADTRGRRKMLCFAMTLGFITGALSALAPNWITFSVLKFLSSSAVSGAFALSVTLLSECTPEARRSNAVILSSSVFLLFNGAMAIIAIPVLPLKFSYYVPFLNIYFNSWRLLTLIYCSPCALSAISLYYSHESPKFLLSIGDQDKALEIMKIVYVVNKNKSSEDYPVKSMVLGELSATHVPKGFFSSILNQTIPLFKPPLLKKTMLVSLIYILIYICTHSQLVWLPYIADGFMKSFQRGEDNISICQRIRNSRNDSMVQIKDDCSLNEFGLTIVFSINLLLSVVNTIISASVAYVGRKRLLITIQIIVALAGISVNNTTVWYLSGMLLVIAVSGYLNFALLSSYAVAFFPTYVKAMAVCLTMMVGRSSAILGVNLMKYTLDNHCEATFYIFGSIALVGGAVGFLLPNDAKPPSKDCIES